MREPTFPFHRCPIEILKTIFECTALPQRNRLKAAIAISQVCTAWRLTALSTPQLWSKIDLRLNLPPLLLNHIWDEMTKRTRGVPPEIEVHAWGRNLWENLPINFAHVQEIDTLSLNLSGDEDEIDRLCELDDRALPIPYRPIRHLKIGWHGAAFLPTKRWCLDRWLLKRPNIQEMHIYANIEVYFENQRPLFDVKYLNLVGINQLNPSEVNMVFPNLETLVTSKIFHQNNSSIIKFPCLNHLHLSHSRVGTDIWGDILCPSLLTFDTGRATFTPSLYTFLKAHPSIKHLMLWWQYEEVLYRVSAAAPQIIRLQIDGITALTTLTDWEGTESSPIFQTWKN